MPHRRDEEAPRVRPLRPEERPEDVADESWQPETSSPSRRPPGWLPLVIIGIVAVLGLGLFAGGIGTADRDAAEQSASATVAAPDLAENAAPTTTTTTLPPRLSQLLGGSLDRLRFVGLEASGPYVASWSSEQRRPLKTPLLVGAANAQFSPRGELLAYVGLVNQGSGVLFAGPSIGTTPQAQFGGVTGFAWHPSAPDRVAWTAVLPIQEQTALLEGTVAPQQSLRVDRTAISELPEGSKLVAWGDWGYLVQQGAWLWRYDAEGTALAAVRGFFVGAAPNGVTLIRSMRVMLVEDEEIPDVALTDVPESGVYVAGPDLVRIPETAVFDLPGALSLSPDGSWVAAKLVGESDVINVFRPNGPGRTHQVGDAQFLGWSADSASMILQDLSSLELLVVDVRTGSRDRIPVPGRLVEVNLGDES